VTLKTGWSTTHIVRSTWWESGNCLLDLLVGTIHTEDMYRTSGSFSSYSMLNVTFQIPFLSKRLWLFRCWKIPHHVWKSRISFSSFSVSSTYFPLLFLVPILCLTSELSVSWILFKNVFLHYPLFLYNKLESKELISEFLMSLLRWGSISTLFIITVLICLPCCIFFWALAM
jgi:hypothetical protein